ncbi:hypothetical protein SAMN05444279_101266 [Ruegeria intermedia]|uniref:Uncharacterized protein n=2 Tax=Ruegeria intermedia TaxID=996115 RepID=A0A1M4SSY9_9RHOB|nr:hypothetical protein SAMN05444279_101266 [Ruegeria intermedia]
MPIFPLAPAQRAEATTGPEPKPRRAPVFIQDAVTPWGRETLLLALWRAQQDQDQ